MRSTVILVDQVESYNRGVTQAIQAPNSIAPSQTNQRPEEINNAIEKENNTQTTSYANSWNRPKDEVTVRVSFFAGYSHLSGRDDESWSKDLTEYHNELRSGTHFGLGLNFFPVKRTIGYGVKLNSLNTSHSGDFVVFDPDLGELVEFELLDNINIIYLAPHILSRSPFGESESALILGFSVGYLSYANDASISGESLRITGAGVGVMGDIGIDIELGEGFLVSLEASYLLNSLSKIDVNGRTVSFPEDERQSNSHLNIGAGVSFFFN